jgi:aspartate racemase
MSKHIGIVASSHEGAALCYRTICSEATRSLGDYTHPEITLHNFCLADYMNRIWQRDWKGVGERLLASSRKLAGAGAEFVACPCNTVHEALPLIRDESPIPWLHIGEVVAREARDAGYSRVGILGTSFLMESSVYPEALGAAGIECVLPDPADRNRVDRVIMVELVDGVTTDDGRTAVYGVIDRLARAGCDAVALACTELPLLVRPGEAPIPTLDSTRLLARAALAASFV